jgi:hypothetical protein
VGVSIKELQQVREPAAMPLTTIAQFMHGLSSTNDGPARLERIKEYAGALFDKHYAEWRNLGEGERDAHHRKKDRLVQDAAKQRDIVAKRTDEMEKTPPHLPVMQRVSATAWTIQEIAIVAGCAIVVFALWLISINVIAGYLIDSGSIQFIGENEYRAYLVSALPLAIPIVLEISYLGIKDEKSKKRFFNAALAVTGASFLIWIGTLLVANPTAGSALDALRPDAASTADPTYLPVVKGIYTLSQITAELTASFIIISYAAQIFSKHDGLKEEVVGRKDNPAHKDAVERLSAAQAELAKIEAELNQASTDLAEFENNWRACQDYLKNSRLVYCGNAIRHAYPYIDEAGRGDTSA